MQNKQERRGVASLAPPVRISRIAVISPQWHCDLHIL